MGQIKEHYHNEIEVGLKSIPYKVKALYPRVEESIVINKVKTIKVKSERKNRV